MRSKEKITVIWRWIECKRLVTCNDHCSAIDVVLHKGRVGEVYNIGGNNEKQM